ncbi:MAG: S9 family peptidase [Chitinophagaceae bacterium]|nr:S9 family peptidase [Chitinophagaceae bacterium]
MKRILILFILVSLSLAGLTQTKELFKVTDLLKVKAMSGLNLSPDGSLAVFTVNAIEPDGESKTEYKYTNQIWIAKTDGSSAPRQLTGKDGGSQAVFSPDGKQIAFVRSADNKPQVFLISLDGGEALQLTKFRYGAGGPQWSPDGKRILFAAGISLKELLKDSVLNPGRRLPAWPMEKPGVSNEEMFKQTGAKPNPDGNMDEIRAYLENNATDNKAKVITKLNFQDEMDVSTEISFSHFFIVDAVPGATPKELTHGFYRFSNASFSTDGKQIVLSASMDSTQHPDRVLEGQVFIMNADGSNFRKILGEKGMSFNSPRISPSGKWLSFQYGISPGIDIPMLAIMPIDGKFTDKKDIPFDRNKGGFTWSADEKYIYFTALSNGGAPIYRADINTRKTEQITEGFDTGFSGFDITSNQLVAVGTNIRSPFEVYGFNADGKNPKALSSFNTSWVANRQLSIPEKHSFVNSKGMTVEYWVMKPANYEAGKKYPLLLEIHGGPSAMWGPGESSMWHEYQYFCSKGYGVVYCNPRGSGGYGTEFLRGNINDWGAGPTSDVLTSLDKAVAEGWADTSRLAITGGSYAGYLVCWIIGHDHRFKAACSQRGVYDLATFFGEGNAWRLVPNYFGGYPWEAAAEATLKRESPINYVKQITTPYIIFHGDNDRRTGFVQSEMLYRSLKVLGRPVEYVRHSGGTHELTRSGNNRQRIDQMLRTFEFFERWIKH